MSKSDKMAASVPHSSSGKTADLAVPVWDKAAAAIKSGDAASALELLERARAESKANNDGLVTMVDLLLTRLAAINEEEVFNTYHQRYLGKMKEWASGPRKVEDVLRHATETQSHHHASFTVKEEADRFVVTYDPCGSGGRLRKSGKFGATKTAHPWSWGRAGVPYYCCHCCIRWEILATELAGYPGKVVLLPENRDEPCINIFYKKPELIPEEYFTRVGMKKDPKKFSR